MYSYPRAILYGIVLWAVIFLTTYFFYPLREVHLTLYVSIRTVAMVLVSMFLTVMYFRDVESHFVRDGIKLGIIWLLVSVALDQGPFVWGLLHLSFVEYLADTGLSYVAYPIMTTGAGLLLSAGEASPVLPLAPKGAHTRSPGRE